MQTQPIVAWADRVSEECVHSASPRCARGNVNVPEAQGGDQVSVSTDVLSVLAPSGAGRATGYPVSSFMTVRQSQSQGVLRGSSPHACPAPGQRTGVVSDFASQGEHPRLDDKHARNAGSPLDSGRPRTATWAPCARRKQLLTAVPAVEFRRRLSGSGILWRMPRPQHFPATWKPLPEPM